MEILINYLLFAIFHHVFFAPLLVSFFWVFVFLPCFNTFSLRFIIKLTFYVYKTHGIENEVGVEAGIKQLFKFRVKICAFDDGIFHLILTISWTCLCWQYFVLWDLWATGSRFKTQPTPIAPKIMINTHSNKFKFVVWYVH